jgi:hypothetical protein
MSNTQLKQSVEAKKEEALRKPNENGVIHVQGHMRIYDPKTQKTYVEGRA